MAAIPRVIISHKMLTHHLIPTATLEIFFWGGGGGRSNYVFCYGFCGWIQLEINFPKVNCIILDALTSHI